MPRECVWARLEIILNEKTNYLIWYYGTDDNDLLDSITIVRKKKVLQEYKFDDGSIFLLRAR